MYAEPLRKLGASFSVSRGWDTSYDGVIVATPPETHFGIASEVLAAGIPVLIEKPVTLLPCEAWELHRMGGIAYAGHTRLYSPAWKSFKASLPVVESVECEAGGTPRDPWWDWGPHLVAMCLDLGFDPEKARIRVTEAKKPLSFVVNGEHQFRDVMTSPTPLEALTGEFLRAIEIGKPDSRLMPEVIEFLWSHHEFGGLHRCTGSD